LRSCTRANHEISCAKPKEEAAGVLEKSQQLAKHHHKQPNSGPYYEQYGARVYIAVDDRCNVF